MAALKTVLYDGKRLAFPDSPALRVDRDAYGPWTAVPSPEV